MPVCNGGDLAELLALTQDPRKIPLSVGLAWHICAQLGRALLYLHFGRHNGHTEPNWPLLTHEDIHPNNVLFRFFGGRGGEGKESKQFENYPDVVLADFGKAWFSERRSASPDRLYTGLTRQHRDVQALGAMLRFFPNRVDSVGLSKAIALLDDVAPPKKGVQRNEYACVALQRFVKFAEKQREGLYIPLGEELIARFDKGVVTDEELEETFPALLLAEPPASSGPRNGNTPTEDDKAAGAKTRNRRKRSKCVTL